MKTTILLTTGHKELSTVIGVFVCKNKVVKNHQALEKQISLHSGEIHKCTFKIEKAKNIDVDSSLKRTLYGQENIC